MRLLVCGGRDFSDHDAMNKTLDEWHFDGLDPVEVLIHGAAPGADRLAYGWANARGVPALAYPADWTRHGRAAGPIRNQQMLEEGRPDLVIAFPGGRGTADMVRRAKDAGIVVVEIGPLVNGDGE